MIPVTSGNQKGKFKKLVPSRMIKKTSSFFEIEGDELIFQVTTSIDNVYMFCEKGGQPVINPKNKKPIYDFTISTKMNMLTRDDYETLINSRFENE